MTESTASSSTELATSVRRTITRFEPLQLGKILGVVYGLVSLIAVPFILSVALIPNASHTFQGLSLVLVIIIPVIYSAVGFLSGVIAAFVYNLCAKIVGGIEVEIERG